MEEEITGMKRWIIVFMAALLLFPGITDFHISASADSGILSDLELLEQLETADYLKNMENYSTELYSIFNKGSRIIQFIDRFVEALPEGYLPFEANELQDVLQKKAEPSKDNSVLFRDSIFSDYYAIRTEKILEAYEKTGYADIAGFIGRAEKEFGLFMEGLLKDETRAERMILLLQEKLTCNMYYEGLTDKSRYFEQVLALRSEALAEARKRYAYELIESRTRIKLLEELVDINCGMLSERLEKVKVHIRTDTSGILSYQYASDIRKSALDKHLVYLTTGLADYKLLLPLRRLAYIQGRPTFAGRNQESMTMTRDSIWKSIKTGPGGLEVSLEEAYISESDIPGDDIPLLIHDSNVSESVEKFFEEGKGLESHSPEVENLAYDITKALSILDHYFQLKEKGISNSLTAKFDKEKDVWSSDFSEKLDLMNRLTAGLEAAESGCTGFLGYIYRYVDYSRRCKAEGMPESKAVLVFREKVLQFREADEGMLWIIDMLYKAEQLL